MTERHSLLALRRYVQHERLSPLGAPCLCTPHPALRAGSRALARCAATSLGLLVACSQDGAFSLDQSNAPITEAKPAASEAPLPSVTTPEGAPDADGSVTDVTDDAASAPELAAGGAGGSANADTANGGGAGTDPSGSAGAGTLADAGVAPLPSPPPWAPAPPLLEPVSAPDADLAQQALTLLGSSAVGASGSCSSCHALGRPTLTHWQQLTKSFADACLVDAALPDPAAVDAMYGCFEQHASSSAGFATSDFGIYAAAAHLPWFTFVFEHASASAGEGTALHEDFVERVGMPRAGERWTQAEFEAVAEWFARGLPGMLELVPEDSGEACTPGLDPLLLAHIDDMRVQGWRARNAQVPLLMLGCAAGQSGAACLTDRQRAADTAYGAGWDAAPGTTIRILWDNSGTPTSYWSRSSPDGRFIASGRAQQDPLGYNGQIVDLQRNVVIPGAFSYDPTFFPDGSGFMVQRGGTYSSDAPTDGTPDAADVAVTCQSSVLTGNPAVFSGDEPQCSAIAGQIGLYEQLGKSLDGEDYWVMYGAYGGDNGGFGPILQNPSAAFETKSVTTLVPMINQGDGFENGAPVRVATPLQGDPMLSPSGRLLVTRLKGAEATTIVDGSELITAEQSGYALHLLTMTHEGDAWTATLTDVGRVCMTGSKVVLSYDERWMVLHHYVTDADATELGFSGPSDPAFAAYKDLGASNLYLVDLRSGTTQRITNMAPGQYALYPHFRSDGWIYFVVRTLGTNEYFAASDAAVIAEAE